MHVYLDVEGVLILPDVEGLLADIGGVDVGGRVLGFFMESP